MGYTQIQLRRDTASNWTLIDPVLADGEFGFEKATKKAKVGDGVLSWNELEYLELAAAGVVQTIENGIIESAPSSDAVYAALFTINAAIAAKEASITAGEASQYFAGDKTWKAFPAASESVVGQVQLADAATTLVGTDITKAIHAAGLKAAVDSAINALKGTTSTALDTLQELAAALNDDPDFAATVIQMISDHSTSETAHADIRAMLSAPAKTYFFSQL